VRLGEKDGVSARRDRLEVSLEEAAGEATQCRAGEEIDGGFGQDDLHDGFARSRCRKQRHQPVGRRVAPAAR